MTYLIKFESSPHPDDIQVLNDGIMDHAKQQKEMRQLDFFAFFIRDENNQIVGGCGGDNMYGCLFIGQLWITEHLRGHGYGTQLVKLAEEHARQSNCHFMAVNTMDWEALDFYIKLGFHVEFERKGFDKNSTFYFLRKDL